MRRLGTKIVLLLLVLSASASATAAESRSLTLDEALASAKKNNHSIVLERARLAEAQTTTEQAWSALFPTVAGQARFTRNYKAVDVPFGGANLLLQPLNQWDLGVTALAPVVVPAAYATLAAASTGVRAAEARFDASEAQLLLGVANAFLVGAAADEVLVARRS